MPLHTINKFWQEFTGKSSKPVNIVARRFLQAFENHGVATSQIPRLLPQVKIADLQSPEKLLASLTPELLDQTAQLLGIRSEWLEGIDEEIYDYRSCYKQPDVLLEHMENIVREKDVRGSFPLRVFTTRKNLDFMDENEQLLAPVIVEKIAELGEKEIFRFHIYRDEFDWGYFPCRIELKAITRIVDKQLRTTVPLFVISEKEMSLLLAGKLIPHSLFRGPLVTNPSLEDYALTKQESVVAKETEEIPEVMQYIDEYQLQRFTFECVEAVPDSLKITVSTDSNTLQPSTSAGKRASNNQDLWEPAKAAAAALWHEFGDDLTIADVSRRIKSMKHLKASAFTIDAIRKKIASLAPPGVRGKSGRKPKKSS